MPIVPEQVNTAHPMTAEQIRLVKQSWRSLRGIEPALIAELFYTKLFALQPGLRKLFPADMQPQYGKLMDMLTSLVIGLEDVQALKASLQDMGKRHEGYGTKPGHYNLVGTALLWTLNKSMGADWTPAMEEAWAACYGMVVQAMLDRS